MMTLRQQPTRRRFLGATAVAAGGVMMVIPAYLYRDREMHEVVIIGEILAVQRQRLLYLVLESLPDSMREQGGAVFVTLALVHCQGVQLKIDVLDKKIRAFLQSQPTSIQ